MQSKEFFNRAVRIKGYGSYDKKVSISEIEKMKTVSGDSKLKVKPKVIKSLDEYVKFIETLNTSFENPVFYRGQMNANYLPVPNSLRVNPKNENLMIDEFERRFSNEINACGNAIEKLVLMQHYGLGTRCLDISENPLAALYFACSPYKKFRKESTKKKENENGTWGEILLFQEEERPERLKNEHSSNVSIIANTAFMKQEFSLWKLGSFWKMDANQTYDEKYINLKSIVSASFIVRVPQNNPRIKNQQGAFIVANANSAYLENDWSEEKSKNLTEYILSEDYITYARLLKKSPYKNKLDEIETWNLCFTKIKPYSEENKIQKFKTDPFNLKRLFYKDEDENQLVVLIPPEAKPKILEDLARFNITEDFIYPDMDTVANEINTKINSF